MRQAHITGIFLLELLPELKILLRVAIRSARVRATSPATHIPLELNTSDRLYLHVPDFALSSMALDVGRWSRVGYGM
ncbi:hypothetical protein ONZ45_g11175 [Pleurotus djamor]|nr:hypothetical protein ONZ45_g11175 [Pleurotus djamor]